MARLRTVGLVLVAACASRLGAVLPAQAPFQAAVDLVRLPVVVLDRAGDPVRKLGPDDFAVFENGRPQAVTSFVEGAHAAATPLHLGLMLDKSESMESELKAASDAAVTFVNTLTEARDVTFIEFDTSVRIGRFVPDSYPYLFARIRDPRTGRGTALYDALGRYVETTRLREGQHVLVLYTDGGDSASGMTLSEVVTLLRYGNVIVYAIGYLDSQRSTGQIAQRAVLTRLAQETGGEAFFPGSAADLARIYARVVAEVQGRYTLGYVSSDRRTDGRFRRVEVRLVGAELKASRVRTRSGYMAPVGR